MSIIGIEDGELREALERLAHTSDGRLLYLFLQKTMIGFPLNASSDALRENHGRRMFAAELMAAMADGIRASHGGSDPTERPIVFLAREPAGIARRVSPRAWIRDTDPELAADASSSSSSRRSPNQS